MPDDRRTTIRGFPAHAGMDPSPADTGSSTRGLPRTRGDGPSPRSWIGRSAGASPHTRGWTRLDLRMDAGVHGFPAHAGMDPGAGDAAVQAMRLPRTRGDGPCSAHGLARPRWASPHTRGWTLLGPRIPLGGAGFPAHAGMDPGRAAGRPASRRLPRTRGDGPRSRARSARRRSASPHTRGWTRRAAPPADRVPGFPAHAGMDPGGTWRGWRAAWLPRTRGDGPPNPRRDVRDRPASPHTRGWTVEGARRRGAGRGFPAHAGMDPGSRTGTGSRTGLPRTRGCQATSKTDPLATSKTDPRRNGVYRSTTMIRVEPVGGACAVQTGVGNALLDAALLSKRPRAFSTPVAGSTRLPEWTGPSHESPGARVRARARRGVGRVVTGSAPVPAAVSAAWLCRCPRAGPPPRQAPIPGSSGRPLDASPAAGSSRR